LANRQAGRRAGAEVGPNDVLVRVRACGVGLTVVILVATPPRNVVPRIPGHESPVKSLRSAAKSKT